MADWMDKAKPVLPQDPVLRGELVAPRYEFRRVAGRTVFKLESKDEMAKRGVRSPNRADALCLTFRAPVVRDGGIVGELAESRRVRTDHKSWRDRRRRA